LLWHCSAGFHLCRRAPLKRSLHTSFLRVAYNKVLFTLIYRGRVRVRVCFICFSARGRVRVRVCFICFSARGTTRVSLISLRQGHGEGMLNLFLRQGNEEGMLYLFFYSGHEHDMLTGALQ